MGLEWRAGLAGLGVEASKFYILKLPKNTVVFEMFKTYGPFICRNINEKLFRVTE